MRKTITTLLAVGLIVGAVIAPSADAKKKKPKKRTATGTYSAPSAAVEGNGLCDPGCVRFATSTKERFVTFKVEDTTGLPVSVSVSTPDQDGDGFVDPVGNFCGESGKLPIPGGSELVLFIYGHPTTGLFEQFGGPTACNGIGTQGEITAVFTTK
jgi:hypothetical protein